tara:strand:- start:466 stop:1068 length:603 start_codon:yes stop_codon:yes gene_type:complete
MILDQKLIDMFPVTVNRVVLDLDHKAIAEYTLQHEKEHNWSRYTTFHDMKLNASWKQNLPQRKELEENIFEAGRHLAKQTKRKFQHDWWIGYWVSIYRKGDDHGSHNHPRCMLSGTYWPQIGPKGSSITLEAPWKSHIMHDTIPPDHVHVNYRPNAGDCMIWPAWIDHRIHKQPDDDIERIAISFNLDEKRYHQEDFKYD